MIMSTELIFSLLGLLGCIIIGFAIKSFDREAEKADKENRKAKENSCTNMGCIVGLILVAVFGVFISMKSCSGDSNHVQEDIHLTEPLHGE